MDKDNSKIAVYNVTPNTRFAIPNGDGSYSSNQSASFNPQYSNMPQRITSAPQRLINNYNNAGNSQSLPRFQSGPPYTQVNPRPNSDGTFTFPDQSYTPAPLNGWAAKDQAVQNVYRDSTKRRGAIYPLNNQQPRR